MKAGQPWVGWVPSLIPALVQDAAGLGVSTLAAGTELYVVAPGGQPEIGHAAAAGMALLVWCHCSGMVGRLSWGLAAVEALLRLRLALGWAALLCEALSPNTG